MVRICLVLLSVVSLSDAPADMHWPQWRGPDHNGVSQARDLATEWSEEKNIAWKVPLPSWGGSTPVVWGDRLFLTTPSAPIEGDQDGSVVRKFPRGGRNQPGGPDILVMCFDVRNGRKIWQRKLCSNNTLYGKQNMGSPSPVTDGRHVWAMSGTGVVAQFDMDGKEVWRRDLQADYVKFGLYWGYASSPLLHEDRLFIQVLHGAVTDDPSYLLALEADTGKTIWKIDRLSDAPAEAPDAYTTPVVLNSDGKEFLIVTGADYVTAHHLETGAELWRIGGLNPNKARNYRIVASPIAMNGLVYAPTRVKPFLVLRGDGPKADNDGIVWKYEGKAAPDVPSPVCDGKYIYLVSDRGVASCLDAGTGATIWGPERTAIGTVSASPILADGKLYITNESAVTTVLAAGGAFRTLATNRLDDGYTISSLCVINGKVFIRSSSHLYCIAVKK